MKTDEEERNSIVDIAHCISIISIPIHQGYVIGCYWRRIFEFRRYIQVSSRFFKIQIFSLRLVCIFWGSFVPAGSLYWDQLVWFWACKCKACGLRNNTQNMQSILRHLWMYSVRNWVWSGYRPVLRNYCITHIHYSAPSSIIYPTIYLAFPPVLTPLCLLPHWLGKFPKLRELGWSLILYLEYHHSLPFFWHGLRYEQLSAILSNRKT